MVNIPRIYRLFGVWLLCAPAILAATAARAPVTAPEPSQVVWLGSALVGLGLLGRKRRV